MADIFLDLKNNAIIGGADIATVTATGTNTSVDFLSEVGNMASCLQYVGTVSGTSPTLVTKIQESTDGTTWSDITGAAFASVTNSNNRQLISFNVLKRYVRGYNTVGGTTPSYVVGNTFFGQRRTVPSSALGGGWTNESGASI